MPSSEADRPVVTEREVAYYNPAENDYDLSLDPRCLFGWGPGNVAGCHCMFGHACFRFLGHPGMCWDAGEKRQGDPPCHQRKRPKDWDTKGRTEANQ